MAASPRVRQDMRRQSKEDEMTSPSRIRLRFNREGCKRGIRGSGSVDFVFSTVDMSKDEIKAIEEAYAKAGTPVVSNNSATDGLQMYQWWYPR